MSYCFIGTLVEIHTKASDMVCPRLISTEVVSHICISIMSIEVVGDWNWGEEEDHTDTTDMKNMYLTIIF